MSFPRCKHAKKKLPAVVSPLVWLGNEPYRLFFLSGAIFSLLGVLMWPLFYHGKLSFYPGVAHAHLMIEAFGGAFVMGFLGTAGPRMMGAPKLMPLELSGLFSLHVASGICHFRGLTLWGDRLFLLTLGIFVIALGTRALFFRKENPPPALLLAVLGLLCGLAGVLIWSNPSWMKTTEIYRLAGLLLNQGFLLGPVMGVGIFLFPRLLGNDFGEPKNETELRNSRRLMVVIGLLFAGSFPLQVWGSEMGGLLMRVVAFLLALSQVKWGGRKVGSLANALRFLCIPLALAGLLAPAFLPLRRIALEHLLFVGGFGLLCLIAGSRVIFGHSGEVSRFHKRSWAARLIVFGIVLAALTRASADFLPRVMLTHYDYAAWSWFFAGILWIAWHSQRFFKKDEG